MPRSEFSFRTWFDRRRQRQRTRHAAYCRPCEAAYQAERRRHRYRTDPEYRRRQILASRRYSQEESRENHEARQWRSTAARRYIAQLRSRGWGVRQIATALGVSTDSVYLWAAGRYAPREETLRALRRLVENQIR
jgi:ribosome-binding protein aMBF1 (putative translation factor)